MTEILANPLFSSAVVASSNAEFRQKLLEILLPSQCTVEEACGGAEALHKLESGTWQALLLDNWLPDLDVNEVLSIVKMRHPQVKIVVMDSEGGDHSFKEVLSFPTFHSDHRRPEPLRPLPVAVPYAETAAASGPEVCSEPVQPLPGMIGVSQAMRNVYRLSRLVALRSTTVLLTGETGTGKELVAKAIHILSPRLKQPFITVNCAAIPESLLEAELFGYARGAFTGAFQSRMGRIHAAHGGTLFLDEVGDLPLSMQAKLLRFLEEGEVQRLGGPDIIRVDVRVIAATNAEMTKRVGEKAFREDLYYRISAFPIDLIPLRERADDIIPLGSHFLRAFCQESNLPAKAISKAAERAMSQHSWPGNVRELRHVMERAFILSEEGAHILPDHISLQAPWR